MEKLSSRKISVVIPVADDISGLSATLASLVPQLKPNCELIVGNDGGNKRITEICKSFRVDMISSPTTIGPYAMRNLLVKNSKGEVIAFIDAGTIASPNWIKQGIVSMQNSDYVGGVIEHIHNHKRDLPLELFQRVTAFDAKTYIAKFHFAPTTNLWTKRSIFEQVGYFDERLFSSGDLEWGERVYSFGVNQLYDASVIVRHPYRSNFDLVNKQLRVAAGHVKLRVYHPRRFGGIVAGLLTSLLALSLPPIWIRAKQGWRFLTARQKVAVTIMAWKMQIIYNWEKLKGFSYYLIRNH